MTSIPKEAFQGATRRGVEDIRRNLEEAKQATSAAINVSLDDHGEKLIEIFHRSERGSEIDWATYKKNRQSAKDDLIYFPIFLGFMFLFVGAIAIGFLHLIAVIFPTEKAPTDIQDFGLFLGILAIVSAFPITASLKNLLKEQRLGYTSWFKSQVRYRIHNAWAISQGAIYAARLKRPDDDMIEVERISYNDIQACVHADYDGLQVTLLYTKTGQVFSLSEPVGSNIKGAANLANHIWSMTKPEQETVCQ
jgi:hypothetical protein